MNSICRSDAAHRRPPAPIGATHLEMAHTNVRCVTTMKQVCVVLEREFILIPLAFLYALHVTGPSALAQHNELLIKCGMQA